MNTQSHTRTHTITHTNTQTHTITRTHTHMQACSVSKREYSYGRSKVFIRHPRTVFELEGRRKAAVVGLAILIQRVYRGWHQWRKVGGASRPHTAGLQGVAPVEEGGWGRGWG